MTANENEDKFSSTLKLLLWWLFFYPEIKKREKWITEPPDVVLNEAEQRFPAQRANTQMERTQSPHVQKDIQRDGNTKRNMCWIKQANN